MILRKVKIDNFRCYGLPTELVFEEPDKRNGKNIYLIGGYNQYGKTTFLNALQYCFFGPPRTEDMSALINYKQRELGNYNITVAVSYRDYADHDITIERAWTPKGSRIIRKDDPIVMKESLLLYEDGKRIDTYSEEEIQQWIEGEVPSSTSKFFFFDGVEIKQFADEETDVSKLKDSIEILLGIELFRELREHLKKYIVEKIREERTENLESQELRLRADIKDLEDKAQKIDEELENNEKELREWKEKEQRLGVDKSNLLKLIDPASRVERDKLVSDCERKKIESERLQKECKEFIQTTFPFALLGTDLIEMKRAIQNERTIRINQEISGRLNEIIEDLGNTLGIAICKLTNIQTQEAVISVTDLIKGQLRIYIQNSFANVGPKPIFSISEDEEINLIGIVDSILSTAKDVKALIDGQIDLEGDIQKLDSQIQGFTLDENLLGQLKKLDFQLLDTAKSIGREKQNIDYQRSQREKNDHELTEKERELSEIEDRKTEQQRDMFILNHTKKYINLLEEYINIVKKQRLIELQRHTTDLYNQLQPIEEYRGTIRFDPKDYSTQIIRADGKILPKRDLSDGGKELYAISLVAGLCKTANRTIPIVIDFPLGHLDGINKPNVVSKYFPIAGSQVILLSKDDEIIGEYLEMLNDHLVQTFLLKRDNQKETTYIENRYFGD
ncbi:MAG: DNA sulfur modification protein DndD [bacterium]